MSSLEPDSVWRRGEPASAADVDALADRYPDLPSAYLAFLRAEDGSEGDLAVEPGWIQLWPAAEVTDLNESYGITEFLPGFVGFGSNGGGELIAFDGRAEPWRVCMVPFVPMDERGAVEIAPDFPTFAHGFGRQASTRIT